MSTKEAPRKKGSQTLFVRLDPQRFWDGSYSGHTPVCCVEESGGKVGAWQPGQGHEGPSVLRSGTESGLQPQESRSI